MRDKDKTKRQLISELAETRQSIAQLQAAEQKIERRNEELTVLSAIATAVSQYLDLKEVLGAALEETLAVLASDGGVISLFNETSQTFVPSVHRELSQNVLRELSGFKMGEGFSGRVAKSGMPLVVADLGADPRDISPAASREGWRSYAGVPLKSKGNVLGVMALVKRQQGHFRPDHLHLLSSVGNQIAVAIENARLYEAMQEELDKRKRAEEALRKSEELLSNIVESMSDGIFVLDRGFHYTYWNRAMEEISKTPREEVIGNGKVAWENFSYLTEQGVDEVMRKAMQGEVVQREDIPYRLQDGTSGFTSEVFLPLRTVTGEIDGVVGVVRDITERKQMQARLMRAEKLAAMGELVAGVAHEVNNPLTSVVGYAQLLQQQPLEEGVRRDLATIYHEARRSARIVSNLLAFARQHKPERCPVDVNDVVAKALELLTYQLRTDNVKVVQRLDPDLPCIMADPDQLQQVFVNLITNARQAMAEAHRRGTLTITTQLAGGCRIRLVFSDDGPGIPPQIMDKIFDPFFTTKKVGQGTGLGLSICYGLVTEHGGRIWAESEEGKGATFIVELPVEQEEVSQAEETPAQVKAPSVRGGRILVVDDEEPILGLLTDVLQEADHQVVGVPDGSAALRLLETGKYDLIISDLKMPGLSGRQLYAHLRAQQPEMVGRLLFTIADVTSPGIWDFLDESGCPYLTKPFDVNVVETVVGEMLAGQMTGGCSLPRGSWEVEGRIGN